MTTGPVSADESAELQTAIDRLAEFFGVRPIPVGLRTNDDLNIFISEDGAYHFAFYERGKQVFDRSGTLDDLLYWYCENIVRNLAARQVRDRAERFAYEYQLLSQLSTAWAKRNVRETADMFRRYGKSDDIALLPDIGEPL